MKADMALDYALFQLDSTRTRCELWISAGGVTEKLASGLLKPFLDHLRAAQEQISSGAQSIRLQAPSVTANGRNSGAAWFSKGTMERFVRFVSIPEVLERVSAVEAECQRLDEAINILASESGDDHHLFDTTSVPVPPGIKSVDGKNVAKAGESRKLKQDYYDTPDTTGDTSKRQLLRAMDGRRAMLQKEQRKALAQAVAAGFNMECMSNLVVFADCFGAIQLREACAKFMALRKKIQEFGSLIDEMELAAETVSTGLKMNRSGIVLLDSENSGPPPMPATGLSDKQFENQRDSAGYFDDTHEKSVISSSDNQNHDKLGESGSRIIKGRSSASKIGSSGVPDAFKRQLGMPHLHSNVRNHVVKLSVDKLENGVDRAENIECRHLGTKVVIPDGEDSRCLDATNNCFSSSGVPTNFSQIKTADSLCNTSIVQEKDLPSDEETNYSTDNGTRHSARRSSSPTRRSVSPVRKVQIGRPPVRRQGVVVMKTFSRLSSNSQEAGYTKHRDGKDSEDSESDNESESKVDRDEERQDSKSEQRRLSVQDAISLFESKKKESSEVPLHKVSVCDSQRDVLETGKRLAPVKDVLRRWNVAGDPGPGLATKPSKADSIRENMEGDLSAKYVKPNNHDNGDTGDRPHAMGVEKSEKLPSIKATMTADRLPAEHDMEQKQLPVKPRTTMQFDSAVSSQQLLQNSKPQTLHAVSVPPEPEKQNIRRWSLPTPPFHSAFNTEQVKLDSHSDIVVKDSSLDNSQALKQSVVKGVIPSDKELRLEQKKPKQYLSAELGLHGNSTAHGQVSTLEDAGQDKPQELSWKGTNIPKRPDQQEVKERPKGAGYQTEQSPTISASADLSEKSTSKGTVRRSWSTPSDFHLEALAKMVDNKDNEDDDHESIAGGGNAKDLKGIFYEQYRQKRDARLRQESGFKRAEREAKMKAMQEAFERSKEELTARSTRIAENNTAFLEDSGRMGRIQSLKAGPLKGRRESLSTPILQESQSGSSTRSGKHVNSRQNTARKISPSAQKSTSAIAASSTTRTAGSPAQKSIPKNSSPSGARSSQCRGSSGSPAKTSENMLKSSAPSSTELPKEPTKPSLGHKVYSFHQEKGSILKGLPYKDTERAFNLMGVALPDFPGQVSESMGETQKSVPSFDEIQQDENFLPTEFSAKARLAERTSEAVKIFFQESDEFRPESQPDKVILKSSFVPNAVKINYEEDFSSSSSNIAPNESEEPDSISPGEDEETSSIAEQSSTTNKETIHPLDIANEEASSFYLGDQNVSASGQNGSKDSQQEALSTSQMSQIFLASSDNQDSHLRVPISSFVEPGKPPLPSLYALHSKEMFQNSKMDSYDVNCARSFSSPKITQLHGILNTEDRDSFLRSVPVSSFPTSQLSLKFSEDHHNSSTVSSIKFDQVQSRKTWNNPQKAVSLNSQHIPKESSKGFKRLLKFGRRSRGSEPSTQDWIAASTSEGDEDGDDSKDYFGEDDFRASGPRSFFSLSSFRSKGSESRSRA